jgi:hypothetical protein
MLKISLFFMFVASAASQCGPGQTRKPIGGGQFSCVNNPSGANAPLVLDSNKNANFPGNAVIDTIVLPKTAIASPVTATTYNLTASNNGQQIPFTAGTDITLNLTSAVAIKGFTILIIQRGAGSVIPTASGGGITIRQRLGLTKTAGQYSVATLSCDIAGDCILAGDLQ